MHVKFGISSPKPIISWKPKALTPSPAAKAPGPLSEGLGTDSENTAVSLGLGRFAVIAAAASVAAAAML